MIGRTFGREGNRRRIWLLLFFFFLNTDGTISG
jgi:hypothetical protein